MVVYDISRRDSFTSLKSWFDEIDRYSENAPKILVGNKSDLGASRAVDYTEGKVLLRQYSSQFIIIIIIIIIIVIIFVVLILIFICLISHCRSLQKANRSYFWRQARRTTIMYMRHFQHYVPYLWTAPDLSVRLNLTIIYVKSVLRRGLILIQ